MKFAKVGEKPWIVPKKEPEMCERMASAAVRRSSMIAGASSLVG
jgi:hypothetical protein